MWQDIILFQKHIHSGDVNLCFRAHVKDAINDKYLL